MYYYQEIKSNEFLLRNIQEDTGCKDCFIDEITCHIINKVIITNTIMDSSDAKIDLAKKILDGIL